MAEPTFTADELASLFESTPAPAEPDELEALLGREQPPSEQAPSRYVAADDLLTSLIDSEVRTPEGDCAQPVDDVATSAVFEQTPGGILLPAEFTWENAYHLVPPPMLALLRRYPAIGISQDPEHGLVLLAAYLEDKKRCVRRNLKIGNDTFFYATDLKILEPDTRAFDCRIVIKTLRHEPGMRIRFWQNTPDGDTPGKGGVFETTVRGLRQLSGQRAARQ